MLPYLILISSLFVLSIFDKSKEIGGYTFLIFALTIFVFVSFRYGGTGPGDYFTYLDLYQEVDSWAYVIEPKAHVEIGFRVVSYVGNLLGFSPQYIIVVMGFLSTAFVLLFIYKYSPFKILSILIWIPYVLSMNMHSSRTSVAAGLGVMFFMFFFKRKNISAAVLFMLAVSFHISALLLLAVLATKLSLAVLFRILIVSLLVISLITPFDLFVVIAESFGIERLGWAVRNYMSSSEYGYPMKLYDPRIILNVSICLLIYNIRRSICEPLVLFLFKVVFIGTILLIVFSDVTIIAWRGSYYFLLINIVAIPMLCYYYDQRFSSWIKIRHVAFSLTALIFLFYSAPIVINAEPYQTIFRAL